MTARTSFAQRCSVQDAARQAACARVERLIRERGLKQVRVAWCDAHGLTRGKTLMPHAACEALHDGVGMVSTLMLKDTSDRTAWRVFEPGGTDDLPGFGAANNLMLLPDPDSFRELPWQPGTGWMQAQPWFDDGRPVPLDTRRVLQRALARLADAGWGLRCGLEVEFHIYRVEDEGDAGDPERAVWPGPAPRVSLLHPGWQLLGEAWADRAEPALAIVRDTALGLGLPLRSLEIELGPSQVEAVFDATDALAAADAMVLLRNGVRQALRQAGWHATFMCRPPFEPIMSSGWHLHQSLTRPDGRNGMVREVPAGGTAPCDAAHVLSDAGAHWLAGLLAHARGAAVFCTPTVNGYGRFRPNALAPMQALWGRDNRGAMLRVIGGAGDAATRIENRLGEPAANPYLYMAAQIHAGLDGLTRALAPPPATEAPYAEGQATALPRSLTEALDALADDRLLCEAFGTELIAWYTRIKRQEAERHAQAQDVAEFERQEYFARL